MRNPTKFVCVEVGGYIRMQTSREIDDVKNIRRFWFKRKPSQSAGKQSILLVKKVAQLMAIGADLDKVLWPYTRQPELDVGNGPERITLITNVQINPQQQEKANV